MAGLPSTPPNSSCFPESQITQSTPVRAGAKVPPGFIIVSEKWRGSALAKGLQGKYAEQRGPSHGILSNTSCVSNSTGKVQILVEDGLGVVDFHTGDRTAVVYVTEVDLVEGNTFKKKIVKLRRVEYIRGVILVDKTAMTDQYFPAVQRFVVLELGMKLLPVCSQSEAAQVLVAMVNEDSRHSGNPFLKKKKAPPVETTIYRVLQCFPRLGGVKAKQLLAKFKSLHGICQASEKELAGVVGRAGAAQIRVFITYRTQKGQFSMGETNR
ncbi:FAAP24 [Branchiostoma lanceolatum]|uniref:FAAP24 protein n=1 Tax=Branchiostoma lanceolatum TaxID=7740 RepID=A0A8K0F1C3_BRALA|nr:FAAP24 [Branchiostoma lanceolatum]